MLISWPYWTIWKQHLIKGLWWNNQFFYLLYLFKLPGFMFESFTNQKLQLITMASCILCKQGVGETNCLYWSRGCPALVWPSYMSFDCSEKTCKYFLHFKLCLYWDSGFVTDIRSKYEGPWSLHLFIYLLNPIQVFSIWTSCSIFIWHCKPQCNMIKILLLLLDIKWKWSDTYDNVLIYT